ncbi:MAG: HAMP domain-containing sensor histidine kinase, partial [Minicystis sp.]
MNKANDGGVTTNASPSTLELPKPLDTADAVSIAGPRPPPDAAALASFFASVAHDLRSPLGVVSEALSELRTAFTNQLTDEHRLLGNLADRGLLRLHRIAETLSLTASLEAGTMELRRLPLDLVALLRAATASATAIEPRREVALVCDLPEESCLVMADVDRLTRAIAELVINAVRFARKAAKVRLELGPGTVRVHIEDDGQGVPVERRATLFVRFAPRASRSGLGVRLCNAYDVITAHGGQLEL